MSVFDADKGNYNVMNRLFYVSVFALSAALAASSEAGDLNAGRDNAIPQSYAEAAKRFRLAAVQGNASAQFSLGFMYYNGQGVPKDHAEAAKWFRLAAVQGNASAQFDLGLMYYHGQGVPQDIVQTHIWVNIANANGITKASEARNIIQKRMSTDQLADAQTRARVCVSSSYQNCG